MTTVAVACGPPPLAPTAPSAEALARDVLTAVAHRDEARLRALALNANEFETHVWPSLPAAQPARNVPWSYVWGDLRQKSDASLKRTLGNFGGKQFEFESLKFGGTTRYAAYEVHRETVLIVRDGTGERHEMRLFGSLIEKDGRWKVFSYVVDD